MLTSKMLSFTSFDNILIIIVFNTDSLDAINKEEIKLKFSAPVYQFFLTFQLFLIVFFSCCSFTFISLS